jgi:predicted enzyme related to lactoylglutathione lyase
MWAGDHLSPKEQAMHKSRLAGFIIDCKTRDLDRAAQFWSAALGYPLKDVAATESSPIYRVLDTGPNDVHIEVQQVSHESRVHLDIEADDIDAEIQRLEALGAKRVQQVQSWWVMEAPTGQRFCVVRVQRGDFATHANAWE